MRVECLVGVEVDGRAVIGGDLEEDVGGALDVAVAGVGLEMRAPADEVGAGVERLGEQAALRCPGGARDRPRRERHDLEIDHVGDAALDLDQRLDALAAGSPAWCRRGSGRR